MSGIEFIPRGIEETEPICIKEGRYKIYRKRLGDTTWFVRVEDMNLSLTLIKAEIVRDHMDMVLSNNIDTKESFSQLMRDLHDLKLIQLP